MLLNKGFNFRLPYYYELFLTDEFGSSKKFAVKNVNYKEYDQNDFQILCIFNICLIIHRNLILTVAVVY